MQVNEIGGSAKHPSERFLAITLPQLEAALAQWETAARDGLTLSHEESRALPVEQVAAESVAHLWEILAQAKASQGGPEKPVVAATGPVFVGIDVMRDEIKIALWHGSKLDAVYRPLGKDQALAKALPQVIDEAIELARQESCSSASGMESNCKRSARISPSVIVIGSVMGALLGWVVAEPPGYSGLGARPAVEA